MQRMFVPLQECRVVIADDNRDAADTLAMLLEMEGVPVRLAYDGRAALETINAFSPVVAFVDIGMPRMSGYDVARSLRSSGAKLTLVAVTGCAADSDVAAACSAGFDFHITKPALPSDIRGIVRELCGHAIGGRSAAVRTLRCG
jgi:CheY-like chemotaxis protein